MDEIPEAERKLLRLASFLRDLRPFWPVVSRLFTSWMSEQFESEGRFFGSGWEPLSPEYAAWKSTAFPGRGILSMMGPLRKAATSPMRIPGPLTLELRIDAYEHPPLPGSSQGTKILEPSWFQEGTPTMPARPLLSMLLPIRAQHELDVAAGEYANLLIRRLGL